MAGKRPDAALGHALVGVGGAALLATPIATAAAPEDAHFHLSSPVALLIMTLGGVAVFVGLGLHFGWFFDSAEDDMQESSLEVVRYSPKPRRPTSQELDEAASATMMAILMPLSFFGLLGFAFWADVWLGVVLVCIVLGLLLFYAAIRIILRKTWTDE